MIAKARREKLQVPSIQPCDQEALEIDNRLRSQLEQLETVPRKKRARVRAGSSRAWFSACRSLKFATDRTLSPRGMAPKRIVVVVKHGKAPRINPLIQRPKWDSSQVRKTLVRASIEERSYDRVGSKSMMVKQRGAAAALQGPTNPARIDRTS